MKLARVSELVRSGGPFLTAYLDVGRGAALAAHELETRWRAAEADLLSQGAPEPLVNRVGERITEPTRWHGHVGRLVATGGDEIVLDDTLAATPSAEVTSWGPLPDLTSWLTDADPCRSVLLVLTDRMGAAFERYDAWPGPVASSDAVDGEDLHLTHVAAGDWAHKEFQRRSDEVLRHNARLVAERVDHEVRAGVDVVALAGDVRARAEIREALGEPARQRLVELDHGSRAPGSSRQALDDALQHALHDRVVADKLARVREVQRRAGRGEAIALGVNEVLGSLVRGQVAQVLLAPEAAARRTVRPGRHPGLPLPPAALAEDELRADLAVVGAAAATDA
ncbi:MAG TPA: Vms1/Ankzf1 family peptidyl-tRNA hydrolase, partial [Kribbellaceae bacterium]|nr:Vms1/Ankzf1 family peptidyl-tRNA hydrolase [Kribbellaceae bacterium]